MVLGVNQILSALADETRRNILMLLRKGKISSGDIAENLEMTPQALSYHLKKLREADLIYDVMLQQINGCLNVRRVQVKNNHLALKENGLIKTKKKHFQWEKNIQHLCLILVNHIILKTIIL